MDTCTNGSSPLNTHSVSLTRVEKILKFKLCTKLALLHQEGLMHVLNIQSY